MHKTPVATLITDVRAVMLKLVTDLACGTASKTEKMVIDPPLITDLPVQVNELTQEISNQFLHF